MPSSLWKIEIKPNNQFIKQIRLKWFTLLQLLRDLWVHGLKAHTNKKNIITTHDNGRGGGLHPLLASINYKHELLVCLNFCSNTFLLYTCKKESKI